MKQSDLLEAVATMTHEDLLRLEELIQVRRDILDRNAARCYYCGEVTYNSQGRHYECAVEAGDDLDETLDYGELSHVW